MFLSWKPSGGGNQLPDTNYPIVFDPVTAKTHTSQACSNCRARKLKCVWDGGGCERCRASGRKCIYESTSAKAATNARRRSKHGSSGTGPGTKWTEAEQAVNPSSSPSPPGTTHQTVTTQPARPSFVTTADKSLAQCESCGTSSGVFSVDAPSTVESMFMDGDMDMISMLDMDIDADGGTASSQWRESAPDVPAELEAEDDVTLAVTEIPGMKPCEFTGVFASTPTVTPGHAPKTSHDRQMLESGGLCGCLTQVVHLVEEIDALVERDGLKSLDGALAAHKEALGCGAKMLRCRVCAGRLENMIMLALMVDKLVRMCKDVSEACCTGLRKMGGAVDTNVITSNDIKPSGEMPLLTLQSHNDTDNQQWGGGTTTTPSTNTRVYSVDSSAEYLFVVAGILRFQLLQLFNLTQQLRGVTAPLASDRIRQRITAGSEAVMAMMCKAGLTPGEALGIQDADAPVPSWPGQFD
ncbi:hypothetical protein HD806DRAFT_42704 [Xylariaceae sp. AK1471]|nr:hypothetical protein HD806DRAFT_42704 [Xylariaceae sp. AK1471]